jgi:hypothetical protein
MTTQLPLLIIFGLLIFPQLPMVQFPAEFYIDVGWMNGLNMAVARQMRFGRDVIFTYGPLGYLSFPFFPEADPQLVRFFLLTCYASAVYAAWRLLYQEGVTLLSGLALSASAIAILFLDLSIWNRNIFRFEVIGLLLVVNILIAYRNCGAIWFDLALLAVIAGVATLVKISMALGLISLAMCLAGFCSFGGTGIDRKALSRNIAALLLIPASMLVFYYLSEGSLVHFASYLWGSWELILGYSEAMSVAGQIAALANVAGAILILVVLTRVLWKNWQRSIDALTVATIVAVFAYKNFVVRQDVWHMAPIFFELALAAIMVMTRIGSARHRSLVAFVSVMFVGSGIAVTVHAVKPGSTELTGNILNLPARILAYIRFEETASGLVKRQLAYTDSYRLPEAVRQRVGKNSLDIFPSNILIAKANDVTWNPRPIFQSYSAYTPYLDQVNATHIEKSGPAMAIVQWDSIDGRLPFAEEPLTWKTLLNYYDLEYQTPELLLVRRRLRPKFTSAFAEGNLEANWNESVRLPATEPGEFIAMKVRIMPNVAGKLSNLLFRPATIQAALAFDGHSVEGRVIRTNLGSGLIVSPFPSDQMTLAQVFDCWSTPRPNIVKSIRFDTPGQWQFGRKIQIQWIRLGCARPGGDHTN